MSRAKARMMSKIFTGKILRQTGRRSLVAIFNRTSVPQPRLDFGHLAGMA